MSIVIEELCYTYSPGSPFETKALSGLSLTIEKGEWAAIMGRTGCGKSTLIQLMAGLCKPASGRVLLDGEDINAPNYDRSALRRKVGLVFQYPECQLFETTVAKDVAFGLKHWGLSRAETEKRVNHSLELLGFDPEKVGRKPPMSLSGGEKRRVAIAGVLAAEPEYLILDEPIAGLDPLGREDFLELLTRLNGEGVTIIMVTHNADCVGEYAKRALVLENGGLAMDGTPEQVFSDVERLREMDLAVSSSREIAFMLRAGGLEIPENTVSYGRLLAELEKTLKGRCSP